MTWNPKRWNHRHQAVLMHLLEYPAHRARQIGAATGYGADHVLHLMRTPEFRRRYQALRAEVDARVLDEYMTMFRPPADRPRRLRSANQALAFLARHGASPTAPVRQRRRPKYG